MHRLKQRLQLHPLHCIYDVKYHSQQYDKNRSTETWEPEQNQDT